MHFHIEEPGTYDPQTSFTVHAAGICRALKNTYQSLLLRTYVNLDNAKIDKAVYDGTLTEDNVGEMYQSLIGTTSSFGHSAMSVFSDTVATCKDVFNDIHRDTSVPDFLVMHNSVESLQEKTDAIIRERLEEHKDAYLNAILDRMDTVCIRRARRGGEASPFVKVALA